MNGPTQTTSWNEDADTEVELSAHDLRALSSASSNASTTSQRSNELDVTQVSAPASNVVNNPALSGAARAYVKHPYLSSLVMVAVAAVVVVRMVSPSSDAMPSAAQGMEVTSNSEASTLRPVTQASMVQASMTQNNTVRFSNPFDKNEVFEFAPGTSQEDARAAVAEVLRERALARQKS